MGLEGLKKIATELVKLAESKAKDTNNDGVANTKEEKSIFAAELAKRDYSYGDVKEIWGFAKSEETNSINNKPVTRAAEAPTTRAAGEKIVINIENEINWYLDIDITVQQDSELKAIIEEFMGKFEEAIEELKKGNKENFDSLLAFLKENASENSDIILAAIKELYEAFETNNNANHEDLMKVLELIYSELGVVSDKVSNLETLVNQLINNSVEILEMMGIELDAIKKALEESNMKQDEQIKALALINETILQLTGKFEDFTAKQQKQLNALLNMVGKNGVTLKHILDLLESIKKDTSKNCEVSKAILAIVEKYGVEMSTQLTNIYNKMVEKGENDAAIQAEFMKILEAIKDDTGTIRDTNVKILELISDLDASMIEQATKIYNAILAGGGNLANKLDEFLEVLKMIQADTAENKETNKKILVLIGENNELSKEILAAVKQLGIDVTGNLVEIYNKIKDLKFNGDVTIDMSALEELQKEMLEILKAIKDDTGKIKETNKEILAAINKLDATIAESATKAYNAILKAGGNVAAKLDEFKALLESINSNTAENVEISKKILEVVEKLGVDLAKGFADTIKAINDKKIEVGTGNTEVNIDLSGLEAMLKEILAAVNNNTEVNQEGMEEILAKINELIGKVGEIDLSKIEELLADLKGLTEANGNKLDNVITNQDTIIMLLKGFKAELLAQGKYTQDQLEVISDLIKKIKTGECNCDVDGAALLAKMQEILEAIKNHECECNCNPDTGESDNNEGILDDLDNLFGARSVTARPQNIENVQVRPDGHKVGEKVVINGKIYIYGPDNKMFDLSGKEVNL